jgi:hypothetical protein
MKPFIKRFMIIEACLVGLPCGVWWGVTGLYNLFPDGPMEMMTVCVMFVWSFYFMPAYLIDSSAFQSTVCFMMPKGGLGWLIVFCTYTLLSLGVALLLSVVVKKRKDRETQNTSLDHIA